MSLPWPTLTTEQWVAILPPRKATAALSLRFSDDQPRVPAGSPDGGQFAPKDGGGGSASPALTHARNRVDDAKRLVEGYERDAERIKAKIGASTVEDALKDSKFLAAYERFRAASFKLGEAERELVVYESADKIAKDFGVDPRRINVVSEDAREFTVGDKRFSEGGHYNNQTGLIQINARFVRNPIQADIIVSHELTHHVWKQINAAAQADTDEVSAMASNAHDEFDKWFDGRHGYLKEEMVDAANERWPAARFLARHTDAHSTLQTLQEYKAGPSNMEKLERDDGVTSYSKAYWDVAATEYYGDRRESKKMLAVNETLAELQSVRHGRIADLDGQPNRSRAWNEFLNDMMRVSKHAKLKDRIF